MECLPTRGEISIYDSLDELCAVEHFLGKTVDEMYALMPEQFYWLQEDYMWMGPVAFRYYFPAVLRYFNEQFQEAFLLYGFFTNSIVDFRFEENPDDIAPFAAEIVAIIGKIIREVEAASGTYYAEDKASALNALHLLKGKLANYFHMH